MSLALAADGPADAWTRPARWLGAALVALALHAGVVGVLLRRAPSEAPASEAPPAVLIDLAPLAVAPEATPDVAPGPMAEAATESRAKLVEEIRLEPLPDTPPPEVTPLEATLPVELKLDLPPEAAAPVVPPSEPLPETDLESRAERAPETLQPPVEAVDVTVPELPSVPNAAAVLSPPPPAPRPAIEPRPVVVPKATAKAAQPKRIPEPRRVPERKRVAEPKPARTAPPRRAERGPERPEPSRSRRASAPPSFAAPRANAAAAPSAGAAAAPSPSVLASWRGAVVAHLNRFKRFPPGATMGTASVRFTISSAGGLLSASLAGSSGDPTLDAEAVAMVRRASPVPAPPEGMGGAVALSVPVRFNR